MQSRSFCSTLYLLAIQQHLVWFLTKQYAHWAATHVKESCGKWEAKRTVECTEQGIRDHRQRPQEDCRGSSLDLWQTAGFHSSQTTKKRSADFPKVGQPTFIRGRNIHWRDMAHRKRKQGEEKEDGHPIFAQFHKRKGTIEVKIRDKVSQTLPKQWRSPFDPLIPRRQCLLNPYTRA